MYHLIHSNLHYSHYQNLQQIVCQHLLNMKMNSLHLDLHDRIAVLGILVGNAFYDTAEFSHDSKLTSIVCRLKKHYLHAVPRRYSRDEPGRR